MPKKPLTGRKGGPGVRKTAVIPGLKGRARNVVGARVRAIRLEKNITQGGLQARLATLGYSLDQSLVARIESGKRSVWDFEAALLAKALKVPVADLYGR